MVQDYECYKIYIQKKDSNRMTILSIYFSVVTFINKNTIIF